LTNNQKIHFSGLNTLRFFAAYLVVLHHGETIRAKNGLFNLEHYSLFRNGSLAVSFFFVLSGFLITYLLLFEKERTGDISLRKFYMRRVYRIFPLYYLLVFIGLVAIPTFLSVINYNYEMPYDTLTAGALFLFFLSFVVNPLYGSHLLESLWSIGVEEYFYLIWAPLFKFFGKRAPKTNLTDGTVPLNKFGGNDNPSIVHRTQNIVHRYPLSIIAIMIALKTLIMLFFYIYTSDNQYINLLKEVLLNLKFELMAVGGLGAYWLSSVGFMRHPRDVSHKFDRTVWFFKPYAQVIFLILLISRLLFYNYFVENPNFLFKILFQTPILSVYTEGVLFLWLILNVSLNPRALITLKNPIFEKLGEISYGIYMYQMLVIFAVILFFKKMMIPMSPLVQTLFFYSIVSIGVLGISWFSKLYVEDYFLKMKDKK
jgi:peptidoglycan/LPS O-acetylase OafA/YrhL